MKLLRVLVRVLVILLYVFNPALKPLWFGILVGWMLWDAASSLDQRGARS